MKKPLEKLSMEKFKTLESVELKKVLGASNVCPTTSTTWNTYIMPNGDNTTTTDNVGQDCMWA